MNANDLLDIIGDVEDNFITEANIPRKKYSPHWGIATVASICLIISSITIANATGFGTSLIEFFTAREVGFGYKESGYDLSVAIEKINVNNFSDNIQNIGNTIKHQFINYEPTDNSFPGNWQTNFESRDDACEYIDLDQVKIFEFDWEEQSTTLLVSGNEQGQLLEVLSESDYNIDDVQMQFFTHIYTNYYNDEVIIGTRTTEDTDFAESFFTTNNNIKCHVIKETSASKNDYQSTDGYIVYCGILYNLHINYLEKDSNQADGLLQLWASMF